MIGVLLSLPSFIFPIVKYVLLVKLMLDGNFWLVTCMNDVCRFSRDHVVECSESFLLSWTSLFIYVGDFWEILFPTSEHTHCHLLFRGISNNCCIPIETRKGPWDLIGWEAVCIYSFRQAYGQGNAVTQ